MSVSGIAGSGALGGPGKITPLDSERSSSPLPGSSLVLSEPRTALRIVGSGIDGGNEDFIWSDFRVLADGRTELYDGDAVVLDAASARTVIDDFDGRGVDVPIDLDHATLYMPEKGIAAPAMGWIRHQPSGGGLKYVAGVGLVASEVDWTADGARYVHSGAYQYISPVMGVEKGSKRVVKLHSIALTNKPLTLNAPKLRAASERIYGAADMAKDDRTRETSPEEADPEAGGGSGGSGLLLGRILQALGIKDVDVTNEEAVLTAILDKVTGDSGSGSGRAVASQRVKTRRTREEVFAVAQRDFWGAKDKERSGGRKVLCGERAYINQALREEGLTVG